MLTLKIHLDSKLAKLAVGRFRNGTRLPQGGLAVERRLPAPTTWRDVIEAVGVPHCEIGRLVQEPAGEVDSLSPTADQALIRVEATGPRRLHPPLFLCDSHLGKLARRLRVLGLDTAWRPDWSADELVACALGDRRAVLSRGRALLKRREMDRAQLILANDPDTQLCEVLERWLLPRPLRLFGRCGRCNGPLRPVPKEKIAGRIPPRTAHWLDEYYLCGDCDRLYWHGTHVQRLRERLQPLLEAHDRGNPKPTEES